MDSSSSLPDNILIQIFSYLPLNSIYKFKCLSKVWLSNLSNPNFVIKWFQINYKSLPWIHYHTTNYNSLFGDTDETPWRFRSAYPELNSEIMSRNQHLFAFKFLINKKPFEGARLFLLGSSNGLALCLSVPRDCESRRYHVCNPLTQTWVTLPEPPRYSASYLDFTGIFCEYSSSSFSSFYKVVRIPPTDRPSKKFCVDIFSSDLGVWESFQVSCDEIVGLDSSKYYNVIILNGVMFWIKGRDKMLVYSLNQKNGSDGHRCSLIDLPDGYGCDSILGESEGRVCYARMRATGRGEMTLSVWVLDDVNWKVLHNNISLHSIFEDMQFEKDEVVRIQNLGFSPTDRNVVLIGCKNKAWEINMQTRSSEELFLDNKHGYDKGRMILPFVLKPMPTVLPPPCWTEKRKTPAIKIKITYPKRMKTVLLSL